MVKEQLKSDGLSYPRIAKKVRRWAIENDHVDKVVFYHTGQRYSLAILLSGSVTVELIQETNRSIIQILEEEFQSPVPETYVVGSDFASAPMFHRYGETIIHKNCHRSLPQPGRRVPGE